MFPNCWDGVNLVTATPLSNTHMAFRADPDGACPATHPVRVPQLFVEVNYQIEKFAKAPGVVSSDFLLATGDRNGWTAHVDYISGWQQDLLDSALRTCPNTDQNNPNCTFHQFSSVTPAANTALTGGAAAGGAAGSARLYKPAPVEEVDGLTHLLVTGEEARRTGFPPAPCTWGTPRFAKPPPLLNQAGVLNKTECGPAPPPAPPAPPTPPSPPSPTPPQPPGCGAEHEGFDLDGTNGPGKQAKHATDCCGDCLADKGCDGVTYYGGYCYTKHGVTKLIPSAGRISAFVNSSTHLLAAL